MGGLLLAARPTVFAAEHEHETLPNLDQRLEIPRANAAFRAAAAPQARADAEGLLRSRLPELELERHEIVGSPKWVSARDGFLTGRNGVGRGAGANFTAAAGLRADDPHRVAKSFVNEHAALFGHDASALDRAAVKRDYVTAHNGMRTTVWHQEHEGIEVFEAVFIAHTTKDGELVNVASQFVPDAAQAAGNGDPIFAAAGIIAPAISAADALVIATTHLGDEEAMATNIQSLDEASGPEQRQKFRGGAIKDEANIRLCWLPIGESELRLCWRMILTSRASKAMFRIVVDAETGEVWVRHCLTDDISNASYRVFTGDSPTPFSPAYSAPNNTNQPATVARQLVTLAALDTTASPLGWILDGDNQTRGNNVDAHTDLDDDDSPDLPRPIGSPSRVFDFPLDLTQGPSSYRNAAVVNLFYWNNWVHDRLYQLGFTEAAGNFQNNNFGRGGLGNDAVQADAQDGEDVNNANFGTPEDGETPRMQMFVWPGPNPDRDGDCDAQTIIHEYIHGLSNRRVGGGVLIHEYVTKSMGEGWSDFYAHTLLSSAGEDPSGAYPLAAYLMHRFQFEDNPVVIHNYYFGIRRYPCSTDMAKNPLTFKDIDTQQANPHEGIPLNPMWTWSGGGKHDIGEVWCVTLWEMRANLIAKYGFATGNELALQIVTDGMGLCPPNPNFIQARNALLSAELVNTGGANRTELWSAFAKRGLGYYATAPSSTTPKGVLEDFGTGPGLHITPPASLLVEGPKGGPFSMMPRTFTLENEIASSVAWSLVVEPPLEASPLSGSVPGNQTRTVNVTLDANAAAFLPVGAHYLDITFSNHVTQVRQTFGITLTVNTDAEAVVESFDNASTDPFDLENRSITFTPKDADSYHVCRDSRVVFPVPTTSATTLNITNDGFAKLTLAGGKRVKLYGQQYSSVYVSENGALTFSAPQEVDFQLQDFFAQRRVAGLYRDLEVPSAGRISWQQLTNRLVVSWEGVREDGYLGTNSFQMEMYFDGVIRVTWLKIDAFFGVVGLSAGGGSPPGFVEADFSTRTDCDTPLLKLTLPSTVTEGVNLPPGAGSVSIPKARTIPTIVSLASSDTTELIVPSSVFIPIHETNVTFDVSVVNDSVRDGSQLVYVTATALNYVDALERVRVDDNENNPLTVSVPLFASESQGDFVGRITVPNPVSGVVTVFLSASRPNEIEVPPVAFIPAGQTSALFTATVIDDRRIDGNLQTTITATVPNWTSGSDAITIFDNEDRLLRLRLPLFVSEGAGTMTNAGEVYLSGTLETNLTISLGSSNFFAMFPLGPAAIQAGQTNAKFNLAVGDNADIDGLRLVPIYATAPTFSNAVFTVLLFDNDYPPEPANPYPPDDSVDWPLNTHLAWDAAEGELIVNGDFETGDFTGWTVGGYGDYGSGGWVLNDGAFDPDSPDGPRPALAGSFSALAVQNGNGRRTLSQEIFVPEGATSGTLLRWRQEIRNHAGTFAANHRFAIELRDAASDALLATLYTTTTNDPAFSAPTNRSVSLAAWRGQRVRLVFAEEDSLGDLNVHLDNISVIATSAVQTTYDVYFGNDTVPDATEYLGSTTNAHWDLLPLAGGLNYYWRIDSRRLGITNTGPVWNFRTLGSSLASVPLTFGSAWKYVATGVNLGTGWRSPSYNDVLWQTDVASFGYGSSENTTIGNPRDDFKTFYFRRRLTVLDTNRLATVTASLRRDDGAVVYVNGIEAFRDNMPTGAVTYLTQASSIVTGADETNSQVHAIDPSLFIEGTNIIAVEVHQRDNGFPSFGPSPDLFFDFAFTFRTNTGNLAPWAVNWITPGDFDVARTPTNLVLRVGVNDDNLLGTGVEIFANGSRIGEDTFTPFFITWTNPPVGLHTLLAVATDSGGLSVTSAPRHILVTTAPGQSLLTLIPAGSVWRYRQNGEYPGAKWTQLGYKEPNDRSWLGGPAQLGYGDGDEATVFDFGINFGLERNDRPITAYFRHQFQADANLSSLTLRVLRDDGAAVYLNGAEVFRNNLPGGTLASNTLASTAIDLRSENIWLKANLSPSVLDSGANIAAAEVHQVTASSPDLSFDLELTGLGNFLPSVALTSPASDTALLSPPSVQLAATATDAYGAVASVQFLRNGSPLGTDSTPPYQFTWNNPPSGVHTLTAIATDNLGATKTSAPITLTIVPAVILTARSLATNLVELSWPSSAPGYHVETTPNLLEPLVWVPLNAPAVESNGQFRVLVNPDETQHYFRLRAP